MLLSASEPSGPDLDPVKSPKLIVHEVDTYLIKHGRKRKEPCLRTERVGIHIRHSPCGTESAQDFVELQRRTLATKRIINAVYQCIEISIFGFQFRCFLFSIFDFDNFASKIEIFHDP